MNFFRDVTRRRRSSSASSAGDTSPQLGTRAFCDRKQQQDTPQPNHSSYMTIGGKHVALSSIGATATLRRVFLPRSRTTGFNSNALAEKTEHKEGGAGASEQINNTVGEVSKADEFINENNTPKHFTAQQVLRCKNQTKGYRSESLGRNINKKKRSSTVPNFQDDNMVQDTTFDEKQEIISYSATTTNDNSRPLFSTFSKMHPLDSVDCRKPSEINIMNSKKCFGENSNTHLATISRLSRSASYQRSSSEHTRSSIYSSNEIKRTLELSQDKKRNIHENGVIKDGTKEERNEHNDAKRVMIFGAQAGGTNSRRGRNSVRPLSADVSLLTSEGRKIGKQEQQSVERGHKYDTEGYSRIDPAFRRNMDHGKIINNRQSNTVLSTSNSEFFRILQNGSKKDTGPWTNMIHDENKPRNDSIESLLDSEDHTYLAPSSVSGRMTSSNTQNSISTLNSLDYEIEDDESSLMHVREKAGNNYATVGNVNQSNMPSKATSITGSKMDENTCDIKKGHAKEFLQSRPQSTFGSLTMKVQELKAQLDVLKISGAETSSQCLQKALDRVGTSGGNVPKGSRTAPPTTLPPPPPIDNLRSKNQSLQHPNTPAQGFEYMLPPNLINNQAPDGSNTDSSLSNTLSFPSLERNSNEFFFPLFAPNDLLSLSNPSSTGSGSSDVSMSTNNTPLEHLQLLQYQQALLLQQHQQYGNSSGPDTTDSLSPPVSPFSGKRKSSSINHDNGNLNLLPGQSLITVPIRLPLSVTANTAYGYNGSLSSSSPSTLSPCSSNSTLPIGTLPQSASSNQVNLHHAAHATNSVYPHQSSNRPQGLKLPQSQSLNVFPPSNVSLMSQHQQTTPSENIDKAFFFFDVITTQEKITKVR